MPRIPSPDPPADSLETVGDRKDLGPPDTVGGLRESLYVSEALVFGLVLLLRTAAGWLRRPESGPSHRPSTVTFGPPTHSKGTGRGSSGAYRVEVSPWYAMPRGAPAIREASIARVEASLSAVRCAARLLEESATAGRDRQLLAALEGELLRAEKALQRLR